MSEIHVYNTNDRRLRQLSVGDLIEFLRTMPRNMCVMVEGPADQLCSPHQPSFVKVVTYELNGGPVGSYDVMRRESDPEPDHALGKSDPFDAVILYPNPFAFISPEGT